ncbi:MAG: Asp-tRNA(Asn)/Glu-tRNA(Gln) amidotransferase subunit GatA [Flavobacteriales bacterium]|nr:Asp-tRNA(Asn)/Glu-tRNA(Gln) amidotransferase subunit GatA [Flavobacteriales bacterium]
MSTPRTLREAQDALSAGTTSVVELTRAALARARAKAELNIFLELFEESALAKAAEVDAKRAAGTAGELAGAIISIKDNICYRGHRVSASSRILEGYVSPYSSTVVERLLAADAVILGRTNCDEFAMGSSNENSAYGSVGNPLDPTKVPGGSSGGAVASVAAGICNAALGSETGGSVRQPASFCGTFGFKPTYGRVSRYGLIAFASSFDQIGPVAHTAEDLLAVHRVIAGHDPLDNTSSQRPLGQPTTDNPGSEPGAGRQPLRIAYYRECIERPGLDPEIKAHLLNNIERLKERGHSVEPIELPMLDHLVPTYYILATAEASSNLARFDGIRYGHRSKDAKGVDDTYRKSRTEGFGAEVKRRILLGTFVLSAGYYDAYYAQGMRVRRLIRDNTLKAFDRFDLVMTPTCPTTAFGHGEISDPVAMYLQDIFTVQANLAGVPAISVPTGTHSNGLPFGTQLMGKPFDDERLITLAHQLFI